MTDLVKLWLPDAEKTQIAGASLAQTLYEFPLTICLVGELGAGKTTFLQAFAQKLGVQSHVVSPTFALEQRHPTTHHGELLHLDLYRLTQQQAQALVASSDAHPGIRCIEWADRLPALPEHNAIVITLEEEAGRKGRSLTVAFRDLPLPTEEQVQRWHREFLLPENVVLHERAVALLAQKLGEYFSGRGTILRPLTLRRAAELHDLLRFIDFHIGTSHVQREETPEHRALWQRWSEYFSGLRHEEACANFLREQGFAALGEIVHVHGLTLPARERSTIEQKILFYADKRLKMDEVVSLEGRLEDFTRRYAGSAHAEHAKIWYGEARALESDLFPDGPPF
ncbi:MAG: tRNA (adenosine(37)-N6)-threonylcarbamoyltransferase complex ATPase subunit type 1 TsaE [Candidatus Peribacteraceae bacterium]|nr:tRNA (adenosine(37)-N6)-threonylcarbamoyltransferase complex ATPase subunit type 1 TsaE [Candidatus Peribacteraceae bacterium]